MTRARRSIILLTLSAMVLLASAPAVMAADGEGLYGRTDDKVITFFCFGVLAFFAAFVIIASVVQARLEGRKDRAREDIERLRKP